MLFNTASLYVKQQQLPFIAIDSAALAEKLLNDLLKTTEGFQKLKKMHEELKQSSQGQNHMDEGLK